jgi:hypothetical protein
MPTIDAAWLAGDDRALKSLWGKEMSEKQSQMPYGPRDFGGDASGNNFTPALLPMLVS